VSIDLVLAFIWLQAFILVAMIRYHDDRNTRYFNKYMKQVFGDSEFK
jgi:membrane-anchored glycerophosphoryl diester phosphodiesterase (GDPDase)